MKKRYLYAGPLMAGFFLVVLVAVLPRLPAQAATPSASLPAGAILAWSPPPGVSGPPPGWLLCNRENHEINAWVPDLSERFLMGAADPFPATGAERPSDLGEEGGRIRHNHEGSRVARGLVAERRVPSESFGRSVAQASHGHDRVSITSDLHLPPYAKVVFIIKAP